MLQRIPFTKAQDWGWQGELWRVTLSNEGHGPNLKPPCTSIQTSVPCSPLPYLGSRAPSRSVRASFLSMAPRPGVSLTLHCLSHHPIRQVGALPVFRTGIYFSSKQVFSWTVLHRIHSQSMSWIYSWLDVSVMVQMGFHRSRFYRQEQMLFLGRIWSQCF